METDTEAPPRTFGDVKRAVGNSLDTFLWEYPDGRKVQARTAITTHKGGLIKTAYLHIVLRHANGYVEHYREQADGSFRTY